MKDLQFCDDWAEKLAARHSEDPSLSDRAALQFHLSECSQCAATYATFNALEDSIQNLSRSGPLPSLLSHLKMIKQDGIVPDGVEYAELMLENILSQLLLEFFDEVMVMVTIVSSLHMGLRHFSIKIQAQCEGQTASSLSRTNESIELTVENSTCSILRELFGSVIVYNVTFNPSLRNNLNNEATKTTG